MNTNKQKSLRNQTKKIALIPILISTLTISNLTACSTLSHRKRENIIEALEGQNKLLDLIKEERNQGAVTSKINADDDLTKAEHHLSEVIRAISSSNKAVIKKIKSDSKREDMSERDERSN